MLAVENNACEGFVTNNVDNALTLCGAVPIIRTAPGPSGPLPDYDGLRFPRVNASEAGWLELVGRLVQDDSFYVAWLELSKQEAAGDERGLAATPSALPADGRRPVDVARYFNCQWYDPRLSAPPRTIAWAPCVTSDCVHRREQNKTFDLC